MTAAELPATPNIGCSRGEGSQQGRRMVQKARSCWREVAVTRSVQSQRSVSQW